MRSCRFRKRKHNISFHDEASRTCYQHTQSSGLITKSEGNRPPYASPPQSLQSWSIRRVPSPQGGKALTARWMSNKNLLKMRQQMARRNTKKCPICDGIFKLISVLSYTVTTTESHIISARVLAYVAHQRGMITQSETVAYSNILTIPLPKLSTVLCLSSFHFIIST